MSLVNRIRDGSLSAVEVTKAYCKAAAVAHQIVVVIIIAFTRSRPLKVRSLRRKKRNFFAGLFRFLRNQSHLTENEVEKFDESFTHIHQDSQLHSQVKTNGALVTGAMWAMGWRAGYERGIAFDIQKMVKKRKSGLGLQLRQAVR